MKIMRSIKLKLLAGLFLVVIPIIVLLIYNNAQHRSTLLAQIEAANENMLGTYLLQLENQMSYSMEYTVNLALNENDPQLVAYNTDEASSQYAKQRILANMQARARSFYLVDGFFTLLEEPDGESSFLLATGSGALHSDGAVMQAFALEQGPLLDQTRFSGDFQWRTYSINDNDYLIQMAANGQIYAGCFINVNQLVHRLNLQSNGRILYLPNSQLAGQHAQLPKGSFLVHQGSALAPFSLALVVNEREILAALPFMQRYILWISIFLSLVVPVVYLLIRRVVSQPLERLMASMIKIKKGDHAHRVPDASADSELQIVYETFNEMLDQLQSLKISSYEDMLRLQRAQLRNLQLQVKPHFLINSLNMVYNTIENREYAVAQQLLLYTAEYFRFMTKIEEDYVLLSEELLHVRHYLQIQEIRYRNRFSYIIEVDRMVEDMLLPPLLIQTFVENTMKHAIHMTEHIHIRIEVLSYEKDYEPYATIRVSDTGEGYAVEVLERINRGIKWKTGVEEHIGLRNATSRLRVLYGERASWRFYNQEGAVSEISIPALFKDIEP